MRFLQMEVNNEISKALPDTGVDRVLMLYEDDELVDILREKYPVAGIVIANPAKLFDGDAAKIVPMVERFDMIFAGKYLERRSVTKASVMQLGFYLKPQGMIWALFGNLYHLSSWTAGADGGVQFVWPNKTTGTLDKYMDIRESIGGIRDAFFHDLFCHPIMDPEVPYTDDRGVGYFLLEIKSFTRDVAWLQQFYTDEVRRDLSYALRRIEYDIELAESCALVWNIVQEYNIPMEYLTVLIRMATSDKNKVFDRLMNSVD